MKLAARWTLVPLLASCLLAGCKPEPVPLTKEEAILRDAPPARVFKGLLGGEPVHLVVDNCVVYRVKDKAELEEVLKPEFYPMYTVCQRQGLSVEGDKVVAELGRMAFGAGGCCATGGTYRSADGRNWKKE